MANEILVKTSADLKTDTEEVVSQLVQSTEAEEIKRLTQLFNVNQMKKDAIRAVKLNDMLEKLDDRVLERIETSGDEMSNRDLIDYVNTVQQSISKSTQNVVNINQTPLIQFNQQNNVVNVGGAPLTRESRSKIIDVVQQLLQGSGDVLDLTAADAVYYSKEDEAK